MYTCYWIDKTILMCNSSMDSYVWYMMIRIPVCTPIVRVYVSSWQENPLQYLRRRNPISSLYNLKVSTTRSEIRTDNSKTPSRHCKPSCLAGTSLKKYENKPCKSLAENVFKRHQSKKCKIEGPQTRNVKVNKYCDTETFFPS